MPCTHKRQVSKPSAITLMESQISTLAFYLVGASLLAKSGTGRVNSAQEKLADGLIETALTFTHQMRNLKTYAEQGFPKE